MQYAAAALAFAAAVDAAPIFRGHNVHDADVIPNSYIAVFDAFAKSSFDSGLAAVKDMGIDVTYEYNINNGEFLGFAATLDDEQLSFVSSSLPGVSYLEVDSQVYALQSNPSCGTTQSGATWGIARVDGNRGATSTYSHNTAGGRGSEIYILDTGIACTQNSGQYNNCRHGFCAQGLSNCNGDGNGHGTHCAGTASSRSYGVAKAADLVNVKVLSDGGSGSNAGVIAGVNYAANNNNGGRGVANMSLGGGAAASLDNAVNAAHNSGLVVVVASGNGGGANGACNGSPSRAANAISTGSSTSANARSAFTDQGSCLNIFAPGSSITSTSRTGGTATMSGTSMASPHAAGAAALLRQGNHNAAQVRSALLNNGDRNVLSGVNAQTPNLFLNTCA